MSCGRVGPRGHALAHAGLGQSRAEGGAGVLAAAVAVEDGASNAGSALEGLAQSVEDQAGAEVVGKAPADDATGVEVDDDGEVKPAAAGGDEGDVAGPDAVACIPQPLNQVQSSDLRHPVIGDDYVNLALANERDHIGRVIVGERSPTAGRNEIRERQPDGLLIVYQKDVHGRQGDIG